MYFHGVQLEAAVTQLKHHLAMFGAKHSFMGDLSGCCWLFEIQMCFRNNLNRDVTKKKLSLIKCMS